MDHDHISGSSNKHLTCFEVTSTEVETYARHQHSISSSSSDSSEEHIVVGKDSLRTPLSPSKSHSPPSSWQYGSPLQNGYDPNRIPSSIFASKPATPMEWSVASNESLFSIPVGNGSFSRDQFFMMYKSGELTKIDEKIDSPAVPVSPPAVTESQNWDKQAKELDSAETEVLPDKKMAVLAETEEDVGKLHLPPEIPESSSISCLSNGSNNSTCSFAFPVLAGDDGNSVNAKIAMGRRQSQGHSPKNHPEELQPQTPKKAPESAGGSWFSCFYCCSLRC